MNDDTYLRDYLLFLAESLLPIYLVKRLEEDYARYLAGEMPTPLFHYVRERIGRVEQQIARIDQKQNFQFAPINKVTPITDAAIQDLEKYLDSLPGELS